MSVQCPVTLENLRRISVSCPKALGTFLMLVERSDSNHSISLEKKYVTQSMDESYTKIRNDLKDLSKQKILEWNQTNNTLHVRFL